MKLSILIPVYKEPKLAIDLIRKVLADDHQDKEIIVVVDGQTNDELETALNTYRKNIFIVYNDCQLGKAEGLNRASRLATGDVLVFFDNDVDLPDDRSFFARTAAEFEHVEFLEFPKEAIVTNLVSAMMRYEFLTNAISCFLFAQIPGKGPSMNGAAFAIRKDWFERLGGFKLVFHEDTDLAARAFHMGAKYSFTPKLKVMNGVSYNLKDWWKQRKRWASIFATWFKENFLLMIKQGFKDPRIFVSLLLLGLPLIGSIALYIVLDALNLTLVMPIFLLPQQNLHTFTWFVLFFSQARLVWQGILPLAIGLGVSTLFYYGFSKILRFKFNILEFFLFYFFYTPIWFGCNVVFFALVLLGVKVDFGWKVHDAALQRQDASPRVEGEGKIDG
jgi:GT2 family glycosyltransferase